MVKFRDNKLKVILILALFIATSYDWPLYAENSLRKPLDFNGGKIANRYLYGMTLEKDKVSFKAIAKEEDRERITTLIESFNNLTIFGNLDSRNKLIGDLKIYFENHDREIKIIKLSKETINDPSKILKTFQEIYENPKDIVVVIDGLEMLLMDNNLMHAYSSLLDKPNLRAISFTSLDRYDMLEKQRDIARKTHFYLLKPQGQFEQYDKKILIVGASGFVGNAIQNVLSKNNFGKIFGTVSVV